MAIKHVIKRTINRFTNKPTLFFTVNSICIIWAIPTLYNYSRLPEESSLGGILPLGAIFIATIALIVDYSLVNFSKIKLFWISAIEAGLLALLFISHLCLDRTVGSNIQHSNHPYLIIIDKPTGMKFRDFKRTGLFDREYHVINKDMIYMATNKLILSIHYLFFVHHLFSRPDIRSSFAANLDKFLTK